jgi:hypothetical protein
VIGKQPKKDLVDVCFGGSRDSENDNPGVSRGRLPKNIREILVIGEQNLRPFHGEPKHLVVGRVRPRNLVETTTSSPAPRRRRTVVP